MTDDPNSVDFHPRVTPLSSVTGPNGKMIRDLATRIVEIGDGQDPRVFITALAMAVGVSIKISCRGHEDEVLRNFNSCLSRFAERPIAR